GPIDSSTSVLPSTTASAPSCLARARIRFRSVSSLAFSDVAVMRASLTYGRAGSAVRTSTCVKCSRGGNRCSVKGSTWRETQEENVGIAKTMSRYRAMRTAGGRRPAWVPLICAGCERRKIMKRLSLSQSMLSDLLCAVSCERRILCNPSKVLLGSGGIVRVLRFGIGRADETEQLDGLLVSAGRLSRFSCMERTRCGHGSGIDRRARRQLLDQRL